MSGPPAGLPSAPLGPGLRAPNRRGHAAWPEVLAVFVLAMGLTMALFHEATLHPMTTQVGGAGDADEYSWFLRWMPYALGHGINPLSSTYVNYPGGINLMWNTSVILPSLVMSPVTLVFGAALSYNVLIMAAPTLTVTFCYIAFRRWTGRLPALVGALIVGFSPYILSQSQGHLAQTILASAPLMLVMGDRIFAVQGGRAWLDGLLLGLLAVAQLLTGEEVLAMEALVAFVAFVVVCAVNHRQWQSHFRYAAVGLGAAAATFALLGGPFIAYQYLGPAQVQAVHPPNAYVSDLFNFFVPTNIMKFAPVAALHISYRFSGNGSEDNAYIGVPLLAFILLTLFLARRRRVTWAALAIMLAAAVLSMGDTVHIKGRVTHFNLPDYWMSRVPVLHHLVQNILPDRFASMMFVGAGLLVALGCDELRRFKWPVMFPSWAVVGIGLVALLPITHYPAAPSPIYTAFSTKLSCPPRTAADDPAGLPPVALMLPVSNEMNLRWQAETEFCFTMPSATGMTGTNIGDVTNVPPLLAIASQTAATPPMTLAVRAKVAQEMAQLRISEIIVGPEFPTSPPWTPPGQAQAVAWVAWFTGQQPLASHDPFITYVWKDLPPISELASGVFPKPS